MFSRPGSSPGASSGSPLARPGGARPRPRDFSQLRRLTRFARPYRGLLALGVVATLISSGLNLVFPAQFGRLVDASFLKVGSTDTGPLNHTVILLLGIFALSAVFAATQSYLLSRMGASVVADLRRSLFSHLMTLSPRFFAAHKTGDLTSRLTSDVSTVQTVVSTALAQLFSQTVTMVGGVVLLFLTSVRLSALTLAVIPLIVGTAIVIGRRIRRVSRSVQDAIAAANASADEAISGVRVVQSFTAEDLERGRYGADIGRSFGFALQRARLQATMAGIMSFLTFGALAVVLWYGGRQVMSGAITPGHLVSFLFYALQVGVTVASLTGIFNQFQEALGASGRIFELLDTPGDLPEQANPAHLPHLRGQVSFQDVSFRYGDREQQEGAAGGGAPAILSDLNFEVPAGQVVALVGPSGAGKSTLVSLLPRFYDVTGGRILLDGVDLRDLPLRELRAQVGLVPQETLLFSGSVAENIRYGRPGASDAEVEEAARAANVHDFVMGFPDGYGTVVGERGVKLSGGQRQRVAIARAILKNPPLMILDEATSALDSESEALVQDALERLMVGGSAGGAGQEQGRTTFVIAHRLSTVRNAGRILVLDGGRAVQDGTHDELMRAGGLYRNLYERQFRAQEAGIEGAGALAESL